ncbi:uncharacterized protein I206_101246 [Kwoniella pini CBS 10737]|uniref:Diphthamide biosynthesis protein 4 n=1 Tax=Kwoniella pini CBS 10737 TaxID=1296096 RepID=A0AAJ8L0X6_9TREE
MNTYLLIHLNLPVRYMIKYEEKLQNRNKFKYLTTNFNSILIRLLPTATDEDVIKQWRKLVLIYHPDKNIKVNQSSNINIDINKNDELKIRLINEAKSILLDPIKKSNWIKSFTTHSSSSKEMNDNNNNNNNNNNNEIFNNKPHIFRNISLDEFKPHFNENEIENQEKDEINWYSYPCRCSNEFKITIEQLEQNVNIIGCEGCGEWISVEYEVIEDDEE